MSTTDVTHALVDVRDVLEKIAAGIVVANEIQVDRNKLLEESVAQGRERSALDLALAAEPGWWVDKYLRAKEAHEGHGDGHTHPDCPFCSGVLGIR